MEYQNIINWLGSIFNKVSKFSTKKGLKVYDQSDMTYITIKIQKHHC